MSFLNKLGKGVGAAAEKARFEADKVIKLNRMGSELGDLNNQMQSVTASIGVKVMEMHMAGTLQIPEPAALFSQVEAMKAQVAAKSSEIEVTRTMQLAPAAAAPAPSAPPAAGAQPAAPASFSLEVKPIAVSPKVVEGVAVPLPHADADTCYKCGKKLKGMDAMGKISMIDDSLFKVLRLTCEKCQLSFCPQCAGRKGFNAVCPSCGGDTTPPLIVPPGI